MELLEREQGLRELGEAFAQASRSEGRLVLVAGEAGIGKTALVEHFLKTAQPAEVLVGVCDALFTPRPLGPLRDIALQWSDPAPLDPETDRHRLFSSVLRYFRQRSAPVVAVFEDVHWADEATLDLIKFLGRRIARLPALIVLTYRDDEVGPRHPLRSVLGDLPRASTSRIHLEQLSESAVRHLANDVPNAVSGELYALTSGNPFFVTELLASSDEGVPATLRDAILARAARLGAAAREALDLASLSPVAIEPWLIEACLPGGSALLDECAAHGMLKPMGARYAFRHELARLGVRDALSPQQRQALSLRLLRALESPPLAPDALSRLAHHAEEAGDDAAVLQYAAAAGRSAVSLGAHREAVAHFRRALRHADALPLPERAELFEEQSVECHSVGDMDGAIDARRRAADLWNALGNPLRQGENLCRQMGSLIGAGRDREAEAVSRDAIALLEAHPPSRELGVAYRTQAALRMFERDNAEALAWGEKAEALGRRFDDQETLLSTYNTIGSALVLSGDETRGCEILEQSLAMAREAGLAAHLSNAYSNSRLGVRRSVFVRARRGLSCRKHRVRHRA